MATTNIREDRNFMQISMNIGGEVYVFDNKKFQWIQEPSKFFKQTQEDFKKQQQKEADDKKRAEEIKQNEAQRGKNEEAKKKHRQDYLGNIESEVNKLNDELADIEKQIEENKKLLDQKKADQEAFSTKAQDSKVKTKDMEQLYIAEVIETKKMSEHRDKINSFKNEHPGINF